MLNVRRGVTGMLPFQTSGVRGAAPPSDGLDRSRGAHHPMAAYVPRVAKGSHRGRHYGKTCGLSIHGGCSDRSNFGEPLDRVLVVPADGGFPCGRRLRGDVVRAVVETGGVVGQHQVEVGDVDV